MIKSYLLACPLLVRCWGVTLGDLTVSPSIVEGEVEAQPSKSYTHRYFSLALLADGKSRIRNPLLSLDTKATLRAVQVLGGEVEISSDSVEIVGTGGELSPRGNKIDVGNSGTTLRIMTAISSLTPEKIQLTGDQSILERPMGPLVDSLNDLDVSAECQGRDGRPPVLVGGDLVGGETVITGDVSSQFISALLIAGLRSEVGIDLEIEEDLKSKPYVEITLKTIEEAGGVVKPSSSLLSYNIPGEQSLEPMDCSVPGDYSSAAFILCAGALSPEGVKVNNLDPEDVQGDRRIIDLLEDFGASVYVEDDAVRVVGRENISGIDADCSDNPDLVPILTVLGALSEGTTRLYNVGHLRYKEVDRLDVITRELRKLGVKVEEKEDSLKVFGGNEISGGEVRSHGDHRIAMSLAVAGMYAEGPVKVKNFDCVNISYPDFVEDVRSLGVNLDYEED